MARPPGLRSPPAGKSTLPRCNPEDKGSLTFPPTEGIPSARLASCTLLPRLTVAQLYQACKGICLFPKNFPNNFPIYLLLS